MNKRTLPILIVALVVIGIVLVVRSNNRPGTVSTTPTQTAVTSDSDESSNGQPITATGTVVCLKATSGPEVASCAMGIKQDDGKSYALYSSDPSTTGSLKGGSKIKVTGTLDTKPAAYEMAGTITVTSIEAL
jgi:hypothetical protein